MTDAMTENTNPNGSDCNELIDGDYYLADEAAWLTVKGFSIRIHSTTAGFDEGVVVDIYKIGHENEDAIASTYAFDAEVEEEEEVA